MRLIDADALTEDVLYAFIKSDRARDVIKHIQFAPTIEAEPVKHGEWLPKKDAFWKKQILICSNCGTRNALDYKFNHCPNCGAKMDLEE